MSASSAGSVLRIATRRSPLALWQAEHVATLLRGAHTGLDVELKPMLTQGDRIQDRSLAAIGGKGLFIKELEVALDERRADIAVHSMKDVPAEMPPGFVIAAFLERADPRDALLCRRGSTLSDLPAGAKLGTSSLRRRAQILAARPDLFVEPLRGNVDTRLARLENGAMDAIILACAGLVRLGLEARITARLSRDDAAGGRSGSDRHRVPQRRYAHACAPGGARRCRDSHRPGGRARLCADIGRQLPIADRCPRPHRGEPSDASRPGRGARRIAAAARRRIR